MPLRRHNLCQHANSYAAVIFSFDFLLSCTIQVKLNERTFHGIPFSTVAMWIGVLIAEISSCWRRYMQLSPHEVAHTVVRSLLTWSTDEFEDLTILAQTNKSKSKFYVVMLVVSLWGDILQEGTLLVQQGREASITRCSRPAFSF